MNCLKSFFFFVLAISNVGILLITSTMIAIALLRLRKNG